MEAGHVNYGISIYLKDGWRIKLNAQKNVFFLAFLLFSLEFNVPVIGFLTLRKLGFAILLLLYVMDCRFMGIKISKRVAYLFVLFCGLFCYTLWVVTDTGVKLYAAEGVYSEKNIVIMMINVIIFPMILLPMFQSARQFAQCQWYITLFQSAIVLTGKLFFSFRLFIFRRFAFDDGRLLEEIETGVRSVGIDIAGSTGSVVLFAGLMCGIYLFFQSEGKQKERILFGYFAVLAALLFMGRLGLYFGLAGLVAICLVCIVRKDPCIRAFAGLAVGTVAAAGLFVVLSTDSSVLQRWVYWVTELTRLFDENSTIAVIRQQNIPPLSSETLFGTGLIYGVTDSGIVLNHDGGYVRIYSAIGLIGCIVYYSIIYGYYFIHLNHIKEKIDRWIYLCFIISVMIFELKEPFLMKTPLTTILSCMFLLELKQENFKVCKHYE